MLPHQNRRRCIPNNIPCLQWNLDDSSDGHMERYESKCASQCELTVCAPQIILSWENQIENLDFIFWLWCNVYTEFWKFEEFFYWRRQLTSPTLHSSLYIKTPRRRVKTNDVVELFSMHPSVEAIKNVHFHTNRGSILEKTVAVSSIECSYATIERFIKFLKKIKSNFITSVWNWNFEL